LRAEAFTPPPQPPRWFQRREGQIAIAVALGSAAFVVLVLMVLYIRMTPAMEKRLALGPFSNTLDLFSAPAQISSGDSISIEDFAARMRSEGYLIAPGASRNTIEVKRGSGPVRDALVEFVQGRISRIVSLPDRRPLSGLDLEPQLIANVSERRERRRLV